MKEKISIITPLYNGSETLEETAESVIKQGYDNWEWILFDDGSTDKTIDVATKLCENHRGKIFLYQHEGKKNFGTAYTRNRAFEKTSGNIIAYIDQDDIWYPNRLSHQIEILNETKDCAMVWGPVLYWYKNREFKQPVFFKGEQVQPGIYPPPRFVEIFLKDLKGTPLPGASLLRREAIEQVGGFEESIKGSEDIVLWVKIALKYSICFDDVILMKYRKHQDSTLRRATQSGEMNEWNLIFHKWVIDFLKKNSLDEELVRENEFAYYRILKKIAGGKNYIGSRKELIKRLSSYPELKRKYFKDFLLDLILPFDVASKISAKMRFQFFKSI